MLICGALAWKIETIWLCFAYAHVVAPSTTINRMETRKRNAIFSNNGQYANALNFLDLP